MSTGERLFRARIRAELSQDELAERSGVFASTISRVERGLVSPSQQTLRALAEALNCVVDDLAETTCPHCHRPVP